MIGEKTERRGDPMGNKLFRADIEASCEYCRHGTDIGDGTVACVKRGVLPIDASCSKFSYDPLRRRPPEPRKLHIGQVSDEDFSF